MSSTNTTADELRQILTKFINDKRSFLNIEIVENLLTMVSEGLRYEILSVITDNYRNTVLREAAGRGHTELCVTLLSSLPPADRLKLIFVNKQTALHWAAYQGYTETVSGILNCLTADQQLQLLFTQDSDGDTALHDGARWGQTETVKNLLDNLTPEQQLKLLITQNSDGDTALHDAAREGLTETVKALLGNLTPEQQLKLLSVQNKEGKAATQHAAGYSGTSDTIAALEQYQTEADYRVNYRKFVECMYGWHWIEVVECLYYILNKEKLYRKREEEKL